MKILAVIILFMCSFMGQCQSENKKESFLILNDSSRINIHRPAFILGSELICYNEHEQAVSFQTKEILRISKGCHCRTLSFAQINRLGNSYQSKRVSNYTLMSIGLIPLLVAANGESIPQSLAFAAGIYGVVIINKVVMQKRKKRNQMIFESRGIKME